MRLELLLEAISAFLDDQRDVISVSGAIWCAAQQPGGGRHGLTATQVLRLLVPMRLKNWGLSRVARTHCGWIDAASAHWDFYCAPVPKHDAFQRGFIRLTPQTLKAVNDLVVRAAVELDWRTVRSCGRHYGGADRHSSSDRQHGDGMVRVVTRLVRRLAKSAGTTTNQGVLRPHTSGAAADVRDPVAG